MVVGLDLAGSPGRRTGACVFRSPASLETWVLFTDREILGLIDRAHPRLVVVDAPLSLPRGRSRLSDRSGPHLRECDRALQRLGIRFFPLTLGPMRTLTARGMRLARAIAARGVEVVEGYPGGSQDLLGLPRKQRGVARLQRSLRSAGLGGALAARPLTHDELDAVTIGWVGHLYLRGHGTLVGDPEEGRMLLPSRAPSGLRVKRS